MNTISGVFRIASRSVSYDGEGRVSQESVSLQPVDPSEASLQIHGHLQIVNNGGITDLADGLFTVVIEQQTLSA